MCRTTFCLGYFLIIFPNLKLGGRLGRPCTERYSGKLSDFSSE